MRDDITAVAGLRVGHATDPVGLTGCTVVLCEAGAVVGADVRGGGPATRETDLCQPGRLVERAHAILLSGGSAYGLDAAAGVMRFLEERGAGFPTGFGVVPIVPAACIFDLALGDATARPDGAMGYAACAAAGDDPVEQGSIGAGTGASVGKIGGMATATRGGLGSAALRLPSGAVIAALIVCNAFGDVIDRRTGQVLAGARRPEGGWLRTAELMTGGGTALSGSAFGNTTIGCIATSARLTKEQVHRLAQVGHDGLARAIDPVHLPADGDALFALSLGEDEADLFTLCAGAAAVVETAVRRAVLHATAAGGVPAARDLADP